MSDTATEAPGWRESAIYEEWPATDQRPRRWKCRYCGEWDGKHSHVGSQENRHPCPHMSRHGYEQFEPDNTDEPITHEQALEGVNRIRNSIVGAQNINWSEHIYPLVSLLNRAGYEGLPYPEAKANIGIVLDRLGAAEKALDAALSAMRVATEGEPGDYPLHEHHLDEIFSAAIEQAQVALGRE